MRTHFQFAVALISALFLPGHTSAQSCSDLDFQLKADIASTCNFIVMTMAHDALDRPYLYVANKNAGLVIYNISDLSAPSKAATVPISQFGDLDVMNLSQQGNYVYLALGDHFNNSGQKSGMAIINVTNPASPVVTDYWVHTETSGAGIVEVEGDYAYLGAMLNGLVILDVADKSDIKFKSVIKPDINYPTPNPNEDLYNARGMEVKNSIVYLCFDAGGIRIINATDKANPKETGRYSNPALNGYPRAYNNVVLDGSLLYVTVDYCGLEVLDVSDTGDIKLTGKWNPYNCPHNNWFNTPTHANEIQYNEACKLLFVSSGKSDMNVLDISDPQNPDSCNYYGGVDNNIGTWGVGLYKDQVYLSYICTFGIPFASNWTGVKVLTYTPCETGMATESNSAIRLYPVPAAQRLVVELSGMSSADEMYSVTVTDLLGRVSCPEYKRETAGKLSVDISTLPRGIYLVSVGAGDQVFTGKFRKE